MDKIPATLEDWIASLVPGLALLLGLAWVYPIPELQTFAEGAKIVVLIISGYVVGHLLRGLVALCVTSWCERLAVNSAWARFEAKEIVESTLKQVLRVTGKDPKGIEGLCLGFLPQVLPRRDGLQVASSLNSSMVIATATLLGVELWRHGVSRLGWFGIPLGIGCMSLFCYRYFRLRRYSAFEVFDMFVPTVTGHGATQRKAS